MSSKSASAAMLSGLKGVMGRRGLDAVVAMSPENFAFLSGAHVSVLKSIRSRQAFAAILRDGSPFIVTCSLEKTLTAAESWIADIRTYIEFKEEPVIALAEALEAAGLATGSIGMDFTYLPVASYEPLRARLPRATFVDTTDDVAALRAIKSPDEVAILEATTKQTHRAILDAMRDSRVGDSERTMQNRIAANLLNYGADGIAFMSFGSGKKAHLFHAPASDVIFPQPGEVIRFDVGGTYGPWSSDLARTYSAGDPTPKQRRTYRALLETEAAMIDAIRPGVTAESLYFLCEDLFRKHGLIFYMPHVGHSFGLELHERPMLRPGEKTRLEPGMVINVEPSTFDDEKSAYHTEDLLLVTETGVRILTLGVAPPEIPTIGE